MCRLVLPAFEAKLVAEVGYVGRGEVGVFVGSEPYKRLVWYLALLTKAFGSFVLAVFAFCINYTAYGKRLSFS